MVTRLIERLEEILDRFDVAVLDQWGVLHAGTACYPSAAAALESLALHGKAIVVLSNSGKRAAPNRERIAALGLPIGRIARVMTSGEALWQDLATGRLSLAEGRPASLYAIAAKPADALAWAEGNPRARVTLEDPARAHAILAMGVPDGIERGAYDAILATALSAGRPLICSNPDLRSPRGDRIVLSPGTLAERYATIGGQVIWYGKPYGLVFEAVRRLYPTVAAARFLMVGDSLEHDVAGGAAAGFSTALVRGGLHAHAFAGAFSDVAVRAAVAHISLERGRAVLPKYSLPFLA